jgi:hypothetical protein
VTLPADADGGVEQHRVDALAVHHAQPLDGIVTSGGTPLGVGHLATRQEARGVHLDAAERAERPAERLERLAVDEEHLVPLLVPRDADGAIPVGGVDVFLPGVGGLEDMAVGIHHRGRAGRRAHAATLHHRNWV